MRTVEINGLAYKHWIRIFRAAMNNAVSDCGDGAPVEPARNGLHDRAGSGVVIKPDFVQRLVDKNVSHRVGNLQARAHAYAFDLTAQN